jgi:hypothetical protein
MIINPRRYGNPLYNAFFAKAQEKGLKDTEKFWALAVPPYSANMELLEVWKSCNEKQAVAKMVSTARIMYCAELYSYDADVDTLELRYYVRYSPTRVAGTLKKLKSGVTVYVPETRQGATVEWIERVGGKVRGTLEFKEAENCTVRIGRTTTKVYNSRLEFMFQRRNDEKGFYVRGGKVISNGNK